MFLKTVSAAWPSRDSAGVVCATASWQRSIVVASKTNAIARVAPEISQAYCSFIRIRPLLFRHLKRAQFCFLLIPRIPTTSGWVAKTQQIWGEALSGWGQADQGKACRTVDWNGSLSTETAQVVGAAFRGNSG